LEKYKTTEFDLVITDICMPMMSGFDLGKLVRSLNPEAKILYISGQLNQTFEELADNDGSEAFLRKPIEFQQLQEVMERLGCKEID
jgi:YesN/AraC family two-component response regulator